MVPRQLRGFSAAAFYQRPQTGEDAADISDLRNPLEITTYLLQDKIDLTRLRLWLYFRFAHRRIGGADDDLVMPGDCKKYTSIIGVWDEYGCFAGEKLFVEDQMHTLARCDYWVAGRVIHFQDVVGKYAGG